MVDDANAESNIEAPGFDSFIEAVMADLGIGETSQIGPRARQRALADIDQQRTRSTVSQRPEAVAGDPAATIEEALAAPILRRQRMGPAPELLLVIGQDL